MMYWSRLIVTALTAVVVAACVSAPVPEVTDDGLRLEADDRFDTVYRLPGTELGGYTQFAMQPCTVAFRENWLRDHNRSRPATGQRVSQEDVERIRSTLSGDCDRYFKEALLEEPAYVLTDATGDNREALIIAPGIVDLDINAPEVQSPTRVRSYTTSAGEMTLSLELRDGVTGEVLARIIDRREDPESQWLEWTNSVSNRADARRILRRWSERLREYLDEQT